MKMITAERKFDLYGKPGIDFASPVLWKPHDDSKKYDGFRVEDNCIVMDPDGVTPPQGSPHHRRGRNGEQVHCLRLHLRKLHAIRRRPCGRSPGSDILPRWSAGANQAKERLRNLQNHSQLRLVRHGAEKWRDPLGVAPIFLYLTPPSLWHRMSVPRSLLGLINEVLYQGVHHGFARNTNPKPQLSRSFRAA